MTTRAAPVQQRPTARAKSMVNMLRDLGLAIAAVRVAPDGAVEVLTTDDPRVQTPGNSWDEG